MYPCCAHQAWLTQCLDLAPQPPVSQILDICCWSRALQYPVCWEAFGPEKRSWIPRGFGFDTHMFGDFVFDRSQVENPGNHIFCVLPGDFPSLVFSLKSVFAWLHVREQAEHRQNVLLAHLNPIASSPPAGVILNQLTPSQPVYFHQAAFDLCFSKCQKNCYFFF